MNHELEFKLAGIGTHAGQIDCYAAVFGNVDSYGDVIMPGAFAATLAEHKANKTTPKMLWNHDTDQPIGTWTEIAEDAYGLRCKGQLATGSTRGRDALELAKAGAWGGCSIGYVTTDSAPNPNGRRFLKSVKLFEVSLVTFPANEQAKIIEAKSADLNATAAERALRTAGFSRSQAARIIATGFKSMGNDQAEILALIADIKHRAAAL